MPLHLARATITRRYSRLRFQEYATWLEENMNCLPNSIYAVQVADNISRFLYFCAGGAPFDEQTVWRNVFNPRQIESWIRALQAAGLGPSTIYNHVSGVQKASRYCFAMKNMNPPPGYEMYLKQKLGLFRRRRRSAAWRHLERQEDIGASSLRPLCTAVLQNDTSRQRMLVAVQAATGALMNAGEFIFAMRLALLYAMTSVGARPSALYTLKVHQVRRARGTWQDADSPVVVKNEYHKTGGSRGAVRLVFSGEGKFIFGLYFRVVRPAALTSWNMNSEYVFFNTKGKPLTASTTAVHIKKLQVECGMQDPLTATDIRKSITTGLRRRRDGPGREAVAAVLCHSTATSDRHYVLGNRHDDAVAVHRAINELMEEESL